MKTNNLWRALIICFLLHFAVGEAFSTHIVGGNIHYEYLGNDQYEIVLKVYRDCATSATNFDDPVGIGIYDANNNLVEVVEISLADAIISDVPVDTGNPCLDPPNGICVKEAIFSAIVELPPSAGGYTLVYQRCCRNTTLVNTDSNDDLGITLYAEIPGPEVVAFNSNPFFNQYPPVVICMNEPFVFDHSATDPDGDELVYEFCNPLLTNVPGFYINPPGPPPFPELVFLPGWSYDYPITSDPAFQIDPATGIITGTPTLLGQFVVGICVKEYRDGELIATTNRDFQFNVTFCNPGVVASIPEQEELCDGLSVQFENNSINADEFFWDFGVEGIESDTSILVSPTFTFPDTGLYQITLIAMPGLTCADTSIIEYLAYPNINPEILPPNFECIGGDGFWTFSAITEASEDAIIQWDFGPNAMPPSYDGLSPPGITFSDGPFTADVHLWISEYGCEREDLYQMEIPADPVAGIQAQEEFCAGLTYVFGNLSENATEYLWDFGWTNGNQDQSSEFEPEHSFPDQGLYTITLTASAENTCPDLATVVFDIYGDLNPWFPVPDPQCFNGNSFEFIAQGAVNPGAQFFWDFENANIGNSTQQDPNGISFNTPGYFEVTLTITENQCEESFTDSVQVLIDPVLAFELDTAAGCPPLWVHFDDQSISDLPLNYYWEFGDGSTSTESDPSHLYLISGNYNVTLTINSPGFCSATLTQTLENAIEIYPVPIAFFEVDPIRVNIIDAEVDVNDLSIGSIDCEYFMSDGGYSDDCNFSYTWNDAGFQNITQWVTNEYGCRDSINHLVVVEGFLFYAPNSFTPNGDGVNEAWKPVLSGVRDYELWVFNRWGEEVFYSDDPEEYWIGNHQDGQYFVQDGVYVYRCVVHDKLNEPHIFNGHITLLR